MTSNEEGHSDEFGVGTMWIVGTGVNVNSKHLVVGTGPLFDFGTCSGNGLSGVVGCSVSLSESSLTNMTSTRVNTRSSPSCSFLTQRLIGVSVSESTNHLCGTSGIGLDWAGSSLLSNCSFSSCVTNEAPPKITEPMPQEGLTITKYTSGTTRIKHEQDSDDQTVHNQVWVISCTFSDLTAVHPAGDGTAIWLLCYRADVVVKHSSFERCRSTSDSSYGGGICLIFYDPPSGSNQFSFTLFNCEFLDNYGYWGGHFYAQCYSPVTVAQCSFTGVRRTEGFTYLATSSVCINVNGDCRFDNCTLSNNEGLDTGGLYFYQELSTGSIVVTDVLFEDNICTRPPESIHVSDCAFLDTTGLSNNQFFDCFSTSAQPHCGLQYAETLYPEWIGPSITSVTQKKQVNGDGNGYELVLSFGGVFTGTGRQYDMALETWSGYESVTEKVSFSETGGTVTIALANPSVASLSSSTQYSIVDVKTSIIQQTSNELIFEEETEPDWTWWHHSLLSKAGRMIGLSFEVPAVPKLTNIKAELNYIKHRNDIFAQNNDSSLRTVVVPSLLKSASSTLNLLDTDEVILTLTAFGFPSPSPFGFPSSTEFTLTCVEVNEFDIHVGPEFDLSGTTSETGGETHTLSSTQSVLQSTKRYEITQCDVTDLKTVLDGRIFFRVPPPPSLSVASIPFSTTTHTTSHLILDGSGLPVGETFLVSLDGIDDPIEVTFNSTSSGSSAELALGWPDTLQFDTSYPLLSVIHRDSTFSIPSTHLTLQTGTCPNPLTLFVNDSFHADAKFCGDSVRPCSSINTAWKIVDAYSSPSVVLKLVETVSLLSSIGIAKGTIIVFEKHAGTPTLTVPSSASAGDSTGLISVSGTLEMEKIRVNVEAGDPSFVLIDVHEGKLVLLEVLISGIPSSSALVDGIQGLCWWETGLIKLHDAEMETHSCEFSSIGMGEIWMESSNLSLTSTQILSNGQRFSSFPSAQQDVMCHSGSISITPSSSDTSEDHWISSTSDCSVHLNGSELKSPHFVATLDGETSTSTLSKSKDSFSVVIVGAKLIPCDLQLEVSESPSSKSKSNNDPVLIPLSFSSVESWNETNITLTIPSSDLSSLSLDEKWTACIVFGMGEHTDSFTFLASLKDRKAQALQKSLPWLIPVIVCSVLLLLALFIVVLILVWRRKKKASNDLSSTLSEQQELGEVDAKVECECLVNQSTDGLFALNMDNEDNGLISRNHPLSTQKDFEPKMEVRSAPATNHVEAMSCEGEFALVMVDGQDTLYNRIHKGEGVAEGKRREIERKIVRGMTKMVENQNLETGTRISPHWILLNRADSVFLRVESEVEKKQEQDMPSLPNNTQPSVSHSGVKDGIEEIRWRAPEQGEKEGEMNEDVGKSKVMVFRLGLILWEIETGLVPFGEIDAVNAHRNLAAGMALPLQKIADSSIRDLIEQCLLVEPDQRPTFPQILTKLDGQSKEDKKEELKDPFSNL
ncbi:hypothetical protein BLNAU_10888 [Blattamonas nauphoetae]|uniref:Protein kinase domain-containing protein n=1 Tax=Blattamonas nauphoetae TaxID=2049346 RepID=A0ABQ9XPB7_9EUKA|nr:hypothetical protein BLNAU_10888 [Blattamonas nauphoetae]